jgi:metal-responsive CopG/Arc/MetJ family transcriptional regulator
MRMKAEVITVRIDRDLKPRLDKLCRNSGLSRSEVIRQALRRHLALQPFEGLRRRVMRFAEVISPTRMCSKTSGDPG